VLSVSHSNIRERRIITYHCATYKGIKFELKFTNLEINPQVSNLPINTLLLSHKILLHCNVICTSRGSKIKNYFFEACNMSSWTNIIKYSINKLLECRRVWSLLFVPNTFILNMRVRCLLPLSVQLRSKCFLLLSDSK